MTESEIQKLLFATVKKRKFPSAMVWHVPNDKRSRTKAGFLKGIQDVHCLHKGKFYAIELKADNGRVSEDQYRVKDMTNAAGGFAFVAEGLDEAIEALVQWGIIRKEAA